MTVLIDPWREKTRYHAWKPHELEWIKSALAVNWRERHEIYTQIADEIGISRETVRSRAGKIAKAARTEAELALWTDSKLPYLAAAE